MTTGCAIQFNNTNNHGGALSGKPEKMIKKTVISPIEEEIGR